jgi:hypothetical protein
MKDRHDMLRVRLCGRFCVYCGDLANTEDHFPPASCTNSGFLLPCCKECNGFAGTDFCKRAEMVKKKIEKKYKKILAMPEWDWEELRKIKANLRKEIKKCLEQKKSAQLRLAWSAESYLKNIDLNNDFAYRLAA